jgi:putative tonB-dependent receptor hmuR
VSRTQFSLCVQEDWKINNALNIVVGLRGDKSPNYSFHITPKVSALYRPLSFLTFRAGYSQGYRIPTLKELYQEFNMAGMITIYGNKDLKPEYGSQLSASVEYDRNGLNLSLSAYHNRFKNKITYEYLAPGVNYDMRYINSDNVKTTGIEATVNYRMLCGLSFMGAYTYINDYNVKDGYNRSWIRPHSAKFNVTYKRKFGKTTESIALNSQWMSRITRYAYDSDAKAYVRYVYDPRTICSLNLRSELPRGINLGFMIDNLFNYHDKASDSDVQLPLNGISYVLTVGINLSDLFGK